MIAVADDAQHPCQSCGSPIANRYPFDTCTPCAFLANASHPDVLACRAQQKEAARERIAALKAKKQTEEDERWKPEA